MEETNSQQLAENASETEGLKKEEKKHVTLCTPSSLSDTSPLVPGSPETSPCSSPETPSCGSPEAPQCGNPETVSLVDTTKSSHTDTPSRRIGSPPTRVAANPTIHPHILTRNHTTAKFKIKQQPQNEGKIFHMSEKYITNVCLIEKY